MDPQNTAQQSTTSVSTQPASSVPPSQSVPPVPQKKSSKLLWIILGVVVLIIGIGIGIFFVHPR